MSNYLLDTNHATHLLAKHQTLVERISRASHRGDRFSISMTVLGELHFAVFASTRRAQNLHALGEFLQDVVLWPFDEAAAEEFGRIQAEQKKKGKQIPPTDSQIAAVCRLQDLTVLTDDRHFQFVDNLRVENWLRSSSR